VIVRRIAARIQTLILAGLAVATLAACAPPPPPIEIRPGIGQSVDLDAIRPPSGATYRYALQSDGLPISVELRLTSRRKSAQIYDYRGALTMTLPQAGDLEAVSRVLQAALEVQKLDVKVSGNRLSVPVNLRTDNRFRSTDSTMLLQKAAYVPHDCFAVIGTCRYEVREGEQFIALVSETTEESGVWRTRTRPDPARRQRGQGGGTQTQIYSIDKNAVLIDMALTSQRAGQRSTIIFRRK